MEPDTRTIRQHAWGIIEKLAAAEQHADATLTREGAIAKALSTPAGKEASELFYHPLADKTPQEADATRARLAKRRAAGFQRWDQAVVVCQEVIAKRDGVSLDEALRRVPVRYPSVWDAYTRNLP